MNQMLIKAFKPVFLHILNVGPFRDKPYQFDITNNDNLPCNFYMLVSKNGMGKTTAVRMIAELMKLLAVQKGLTAFGNEDLDTGSGLAQLDVLVNYSDDIAPSQQIILSLVAGRNAHSTNIKYYSPEELDRYSASEQALLAFERKPSLHSGETVIMAQTTSAFAEQLLTDVAHNLNAAEEVFYEPNNNLPTALFFSAYRDIPKVESNAEKVIGKPFHWGYKPAHLFDPHSRSWQESIDNLLVWINWLSKDLLDKSLDIVRTKVFNGTDKYIEGVQKNSLTAIVRSGDNQHRLDQLSSGEKNLVHHYLRLGSLMTENTLLLVDEFDVHLHIRWQHKMLNHLRDFARENPGMTVIVSTHSSEMLKMFTASLNKDEPGLVKGGHLIDDDLNID